VDFVRTKSHCTVQSVPSSEAVPVALHANIDVINRDNSISSVPSTSDITEIKIESDNEDASLNDSFLTGMYKSYLK
jgi:hypothetical protein